MPATLRVLEWGALRVRAKSAEIVPEGGICVGNSGKVVADREEEIQQCYLSED